MNLLTIFFTAWWVGFSGAIMPGPLLTVTIRESARRGGRVGLVMMVGHAVLELLLVLALIMGLQDYLNNPRFVTAVSVLGGLFLLWMAYSMLKEVFTGRLVLDLSGGSGRAAGSLVLAGILVSLSNPYWTIWWATIGLNYITNAWALGLTGVAFFFVGHIMADFTWYGAVSFAVARGRSLMSNKVYRGLIAVCGTFLAFLAAAFLWSGITNLLHA